jgi:hypothetical protein
MFVSNFISNVMTNLFFNYLLESSICLMLFLVTYKYLISNLTHFLLMRAYLLISLGLSLILPFVIIPIQWHSSLLSTDSIAGSILLTVNQSAIVSDAFPSNPLIDNSGLTIQLAILYGILIIYSIGFVYKAFLFTRNLLLIRNFIKNNFKGKEGNYWIVNFNCEMPAFSFFNYIFINRNFNNLSSHDIETIKNHEIVHAKHLHSLDVLFAELTNIVFWFNPFMNYMRKSLREIHEFTVDEIIAGYGEQKKAYAQLLLSLATETKVLTLAAGFTGKHIKRRILTVIKPRTLPIHKLLFIVLIPLSVFMLMAFSFIKNPGKGSNINQQHEVKLSDLKIGQITWKGNNTYSSEKLNKILGLKRGDGYNYSDLYKRVMDGGDVQSFYLDNGYVFYKADILETNKKDGYVDLTFSVYEGIIGKIGIVSVKGNKTVTSEEILNKIVIKSGDLFNKTKIVNSVRAIAAMNKFVPEKIEPVPIPVPENSTNEYAVVDLEFRVTEIDKK